VGGQEGDGKRDGYLADPGGERKREAALRYVLDVTVPDLTQHRKDMAPFRVRSRSRQYDQSGREAAPEQRHAEPATPKQR
jgi:hypothetical protein